MVKSALKILTKEKFSKEIERLVEKGGYTYMEAILELCDKYDLEVESCKKLCSKSIIENFSAEAFKRNLIKKESHL